RPPGLTLFPYTTLFRSGHLDEPLAREVYEQWKGMDVTEVGFMTRNIEGYVLGFSPDGLVSDDGLVEIKSRKPQLQLQYVLTGDIDRKSTRLNSSHVSIS